MKRQFLSIVSAVFILALSFTACKKDDKAPSQNGFTKEKLVGTYRISALTTTVNGNPFDILATWDDCEKDNLLILQSDLTYNSVDAGETCTDPGDEEGEWSVSGNKLELDGEELTIDKFEGNRLELSGNLTIENVTYPIKTVYVKQ